MFQSCSPSFTKYSRPIHTVFLRSATMYGLQLLNTWMRPTWTPPSCT